MHTVSLTVIKAHQGLGCISPDVSRKMFVECWYKTSFTVRTPFLARYQLSQSTKGSNRQQLPTE